MGLPQLANPERTAALAFASAIAPPPPVDLQAWAVEHVVFGSDSPAPGPYRPGFMPWNGPILEALGPDDPCTDVYYAKSIQVGGTALALIFIMARQALDPGPAMIVHPTESNQRRLVRTKLRPFVRNSAALRRLFPERSRDAGASVDFQERIDGRGFVQHAAATSASDLSQVSIRDLVGDDLDKWETDGTTGDPERNAAGRTEAYLRAGLAKRFWIGNPVETHRSRIWRGYEAGTQEVWSIPCDACGALTWLDWTSLLASAEAGRQSRRDAGMPDEEAMTAAAAAACFSCVHCGGAVTEARALAVMAEGAMTVRNPTAGPGIRSFHVWSAYLGGWPKILTRWWRDQGNPETEQSFRNEVLGLPYETAGEAPDWQILARRAADGHDLGTIPEGGLILVAGADCQGSSVLVHVMAFGAALRRWTVEYVVLPGHIREDATRAALDALLARTWPGVNGQRRSIELFGVDAGAYKTDVEGWVARHSPHRVWMVRGSKDQFAADLVLVQSRTRRREARAVTGRSGHTIHWVGAAGIKSQLYSCLLREDPLGPGWVGFPKGLGDEFFRQLCAEKRARQKKSGEYRWEKIYETNDALDTAVYAQALAVALGWKANSPDRWEELRQRFEAPADPQADLFAAASSRAVGGVPDRRGATPGPPVPEGPAAPSSPANAVRGPSLAARLAALNQPDEP